MTNQRVQFNNVIQNQLPSYVREEFPLISEFLKQYYLSQEVKSAPLDLIQNIDKYIKLNENTNLVSSTILRDDVDFIDDTIVVDLTFSPTGTQGYPDTYGLIQIDNEIITYTGKTDRSFTGCIRGFSGTLDYTDENNLDVLTFSSTEAEEHKKGSEIKNLSSLFLTEFLIKIKRQLLPGLSNTELNSELNQNIFIKQSKDFYSSKGTDRSFEILFGALYNEKVKVLKPSEYLIQPSNANYVVTNDLVVEAIVGDPLQLENSTLYQDKYRDTFEKSFVPISKVEEVVSKTGKSYYKLGYDAGYNRDLNVDGALYGNFKVHPKTKVIGNVSSGSDVIDVDSTIGFESSGELLVTYSDETFGVIEYTSKSNNQFYGCSNITGTILDASDISVNTYAYGSYINESGEEEIVEVRINSVLNSLDYPEDNQYYTENDSVVVQSLGSNAKDLITKNWIYNLPSRYKVNNIDLLSSVDRTYKIFLENDQYLYIGDSISLIQTNGVSINGRIISIDSKNSFSASFDNDLNLNLFSYVKRNIKKSFSNNFVDISKYWANVQNVYTNVPETITNKPSKILVSSNSLPNYNEQTLNAKSKSVTFSGSFFGEDLTILDHGFYTGDVVYYTPQKVTESSTDIDGIVTTTTSVQSSLFLEGEDFLFGEGIYYIKKVNQNTIKLSKSISDIYNSRFLSIGSETGLPAVVSGSKLEFVESNNKTLKPQKLLREICDPIVDGDLYETQPGFNGILVNGVEILNYKSSDVIYYGEIESIEVTSPGSEYDIINPPNLVIEDSIGTGATGNVSLSGSLNEIRILDSGFDYQNVPTIKISGGNGFGAKAIANMTLVEHSPEFYSDQGSARISIGSSQSTIGFGTYHKFRNAEKVIYQSNSQQEVGGLISESFYYLSIVDAFTVKVHENQNDAILGINTITLTSYGEGKQNFKSVNNKSVVDSINVVSAGVGYENKLRTVPSSGISTSSNEITIKNHGYNSKEIVKYITDGTEIGGLTNDSEYYITKIDDDNFKLSLIGNDSDKLFYFNTNQYINLTSFGSGTHQFNYPDISVTINGAIGISSVGTETFECKIKPIFRGGVTSINLTNNGVGYGSSDIINYRKDPLISLTSGNGAQVQPIVSNGTITEVLVLNGGSGYTSDVDLIIDNDFGNGIGAVLTPIIENGSLSEVKVIGGGINYDQSTLSILVSSPGAGATFLPKVKKWNINLFERYLKSFTQDDGFISKSINPNRELQYSHIYAPRKLREILFSTDQSGETVYGQKDLTRESNVEIDSKYHSPIIGWAYDGHPIYGPYGYNKITGGIITQLKSGYVLNSTRPFGPPTEIYPLGFFVEDYTYKNVSDENTLDENNGRFCVTPEFPKGTYAYFATLDLAAGNESPFSGYKKPVFPYLIGNNFKAAPNQFNYKSSSNQDDYDLNNSNWLRNTAPYNLSDKNINYEYLNIPNELDQEAKLLQPLTGKVDNIGILTGGKNYKVNDNIVFSNENTGGSGVSAKVSKLEGKTVSNISVATSSITNIEMVSRGSNNQLTLIAPNPHNFEDEDIITLTSFSNDKFKFDGNYNIGVGSSSILSLVGLGTTTVAVEDVSSTGIVTYFNVRGIFEDLKANDILGIGTERVKVLNVDKELSRIRVLRSIEGTSGSSHDFSTILNLDHKRLTINTGIPTDFNFKENKEIYFEPSESVALGTSFGVGITSTLYFSNPGAGSTQISIPTKSIYLKNHGLETGDIVTYSPNVGSGISVKDLSGTEFSLIDQQSLYVAKLTDNLIGLSTVKVGLGTLGSFVGIASTERSSSTLFFVGLGTGTYHSFKTNYESLTSEISRNVVNVATSETHGMKEDHDVFVNVNPGLSTEFVVNYNDFNRKLVINPFNFVSGDVNTTNNSITISNHGFSNGQKVLYSATTAIGGLVNNFEYYVFRVDNNTIKLSNSYYDSTKSNPSTINLTSASDGTISLVNPPLTVYRDSTVTFNLADSSLSYLNNSVRYPAFEFDFYIDENMVQKYEKNIDSDDFQVTRTGTIGVSTNASITLTINSKTPNNIYYKLNPVYDSILPKVKKEIVEDSEVKSNNAILSKYSVYNGKYRIKSVTDTTFKYLLPKTPEKVSYASSTSELSYETDCTHAFGTISEIVLTNGGNNYKFLPEILSVNTENGSGAEFELSSSSIGKSKKIEITDIGFDFSSDKTVRPSASFPQVLKIDSLYSFESIGITSVGVGYIKSPKLLVFDGKNKNQITDIDIEYTLGDTQVTIIKNTFSLNNVPPTILPIQNTNGVGISTIEYNSNTKDVTVTLSVGFSDFGTFPFSVGDNVIVEGVNVQSSSVDELGVITVEDSGEGFNSEDYNYKLFTISAVDENIGGIGSVTFNLDGYIEDGKTPGIFNPTKSSARIVPEKHFPIFNSVLKENAYIEGEKVNGLNSNAEGIVQSWDSANTLLKVSSRKSFEIDEIAQGKISKSQGIVSKRSKNLSSFKIDLQSNVINGWQNIYGFLNNNLQRIQDSFYYQKFSYSLKSRVDYDTWDSVVSSLNHTLGFKKFSDLQLESVSDLSNAVQVPDDVGYIEVINDLTSFIDLNCVNDFDFVSENSKVIGGRLISDEIVFSTRILTDYFESIGNRVLSIDDISESFNSNPRPTKYSVVDTFDLSRFRAQKYFILVSDKRFTAQRQLMAVTTITDDNYGYVSQYGRIESQQELGSFDLFIDSSNLTGSLVFFPIKFVANDYNLTRIEYKLEDVLLGIGSTNIGGVSTIESNSVQVNSGISTTIVSVANTFSTLKVLLEITPDISASTISYGSTSEFNSLEFEFNELTVVNNGTDVSILEYGRLNTTFLNEYSLTGYGTYFGYIDGGDLKIDFTPSVGFGTVGVVNSIVVGLANSESTGSGSIDLSNALVDVKTTSIASSGSPTENVIGFYEQEYEAAYFLVQIIDTSNNEYESMEVMVLDDYISNSGTGDSYYVEFGNVITSSGLGTIGTRVSAGGTVDLLFTPKANIDTQVKVYMNSLKHTFPSTDPIDFTNAEINSEYSSYTGTNRNVKRSFNLFHKNDPIFERYFNPQENTIVDIQENTIEIPNHFFVTGENIIYYNTDSNTSIGDSLSVGIATTSITGVGVTDKLPSGVESSLYVIKVNTNKIQLASSAADALNSIPKVLDLTSVGIGSEHRFVATNQNAKAIISLDNVIQSPVVSSAVTTTLTDSIVEIDDLITLSSVDSIFGSDLLKVNNEIMKVESVGVGGTNILRVRREWLGTGLSTHSSGDLVTKVVGNYNITGNVLTFSEAPYGNTPIGSTTNPPDERDWEGITESSSFHGRTFMRSGIVNSSNDTYYKNYLFDDISDNFDGDTSEFTLKSNGSNVSGISDENAIVLINHMFQSPGISENYTLSENVGVTTISFTGTATSTSSDANTTNLPRGGIILSVGSSEGLGYQPLISAGGTATVSGLGTISAISIGNSGSGYRAGVQTVNVGVYTAVTGNINVEFIGTATVSNGNVVSIAITNPGSGYTSTNPPYVVFDDPLSYSNIPLEYSSTSSGIGTAATIDVVVGQGSSVISFEVRNTGYKYEIGDILTLPIGGLTGIPTTSSYSEFQLTVDEVFVDEFSGWSVGELEVLDNFDNLFDNETKVFQIKRNQIAVTILASPGSQINIQDNLLIFINDILQVPGESYSFTGGSLIKFNEAPKVGDTSKIIFYKGSKDVDVLFREIIETVKEGDELTIYNERSLGQDSTLLEEERTVTSVISADLVSTYPYYGPGNTADENLLRPVIWCRQTEDRIINGQEVGKDRELYEPIINPCAYLIDGVGIGSTIVYVDNIRPFFDPANENDISVSFQNNVTIVSQNEKVAAAATAVVSSGGTITSIIISDGGNGYTSTPSVTIQSPNESGTISTAIASITSGIVISITVSNPGSGYDSTNPPQVLIGAPTFDSESNKVISYEGDSGTIVGFGSTTIGGVNKIIFDLYIPEDSYLRDSAIAGSAVTLSSLSVGDYFVVYNSNIELEQPQNSYGNDTSLVGVATNFVDTTYQVNSSELIQVNVPGIGNTFVNRIYSNISSGIGTTTYSGTISTSNYFGNYSWGKITLDGRTEENSFDSYTLNGFSGITTSSLVSRTSSLRYIDYLV